MTPRRTRMAAIAALLLILGVYAVALAVMRTGMVARAPFALSIGVFMDLVVTAPLLMYLIGIRKGGLPRWLLVATLIAGLAVAAAILPEDQRGILELAGFAWALAECCLLIFFVTRLRSIKRIYSESRRAGLSLRSALEQGLATVLGRPLIAALLAQELAILYYGVFGWFKRAPHADDAFAYHRKNPWFAVMLCLAFLTVAEGGAAHLILLQLSSVAAVAVSTLHVYTLLWLFGDYQMMRHTPVRLTRDELIIEIGFRRRARIPRAEILAVDANLAKADEHINAVAMGDPNLIVELSRPVSVDLPLGRRALARTIGLKLDEPDDFIATYLARP